MLMHVRATDAGAMLHMPVPWMQVLCCSFMEFMRMYRCYDATCSIVLQPTCTHACMSYRLAKNTSAQAPTALANAP